MDLKEFIQETLIQVAQASKNASEQMQRENLGEGVQDNNSIKT